MGWLTVLALYSTVSHVNKCGHARTESCSGRLLQTGDQYGGKGTHLARKLSMCLLEQCRLMRKSVNHLRPPQDGLTFQFHYFVADFRWALSGIQNIRSIPKTAQDCNLSPNFHSQLTHTGAARLASQPH